MTARSVARVIPAQPTSDGAGVRLQRVVGSTMLPDVDPFLLLDEFRSDDPDDYIAGFPNHPHRGFETVTYMLAGAMEHRDSVGNHGRLGPGDVQWMTAGRGIVHSEMPKQEQGLMWGFQLWVNLPAASKLVAPRYQNIPAAQVPQVALPGGGRVRVIAGAYAGQQGPVSGVATDPHFLDVSLVDEAITLELPADHAALLYPFEGSVQVGSAEEGGVEVPRNQAALLNAGDQLHVQGSGRFLLLAGRPLREPVARYGPFVMNTRAELAQAFDDYQAGKLGR